MGMRRAPLWQHLRADVWTQSELKRWNVYPLLHLVSSSLIDVYRIPLWQHLRADVCTQSELKRRTFNRCSIFFRSACAGRPCGNTLAPCLDTDRIKAMERLSV